MVRAKFKVEEVTESIYRHKVTLSTVTSGGIENKKLEGV